MANLSWQMKVDVLKLSREPRQTEKTDFCFPEHEKTGPLAEMVRLILSKTECDRGRFVIKVGNHEYRRKEIEHLAARPDFPR